MSNKALIPVQFAAPIGSLDAYVAMVNRIPLLTPEEEIELATDFHKHQNLEAARKLVMAHLRYVVKIARGFDGYGLQLADLIQEGNIGLMKAVKRFDPAMGVRLVSFAIHWIKSEIHEFIIRNWRIVKVATTKAQRKLFFNLRKAKKGLTWLSRQEMQDIATDLKVPVEEVKEMEMRLHAHDADVNYQMDSDEEVSSPFPLHYLEDESANPAQVYEAEVTETKALDHLRDALEKLDARQRMIIQRRWLDAEKATLEELATELGGISCERVRQLEKAAMQKIAKMMA